MSKNFVPVRVDFDAADPANSEQRSAFYEETTQTFNRMGTRKSGATISGIKVDSSDNYKIILQISGKTTTDQDNWIKQRLG